MSVAEFLRGVRASGHVVDAWEVLVCPAEFFSARGESENEPPWRVVDTVRTSEDLEDALAAVSRLTPGDLGSVRRLSQSGTRVLEPAWLAVDRAGRLRHLPRAATWWDHPAGARNWTARTGLSDAWPDAWQRCLSAEWMAYAAGRVLPMPELARWLADALAPLAGLLRVGASRAAAEALLTAVRAGRDVADRAAAFQAALVAQPTLPDGSRFAGPFEGSASDALQRLGWLPEVVRTPRRPSYGWDPPAPDPAALAACECAASAAEAYPGLGNGADPTSLADAVRRAVPFDRIVLAVLDAAATPPAGPRRSR